MEKQVKEYQGYLRYIWVIGFLILGRRFGSGVYQVVNIYTVPIFSGAVAMLFLSLETLGGRVAKRLEKNQFPIWILGLLCLTELIVYFISLIEY